MGDRVAVMRKGELQQVAEPQTLYDRPVNLFVGGFIGSPAMNMLEATLEQQNGGLRREDRRRRRSRLGARDARRAARAARIRRASTVVSASGRRTSRTRRSRPTRRPTAGCTGTVELTRGARLGDHGALRDRGEARRRPTRCASSPRTSATSARCRSSAAATDARRRLVGRFGARSRVRSGERRRGRGRHARAALLRSRDRARDLRRNLHERSIHETASRIVVARRSPSRSLFSPQAAGRRNDAAACDSASARRARVSGSITFDGIWTGAEAKSFGDVIKAFNKKYPNVKVNYKPVGNNIPTVLAPPSPAAIRRTWRTSRSRASSSSSRRRAS